MRSGAIFENVDYSELVENVLVDAVNGKNISGTGLVQTSGTNLYQEPKEEEYTNEIAFLIARIFQENHINLKSNSVTFGALCARFGQILSNGNTESEISRMSYMEGEMTKIAIKTSLLWKIFPSYLCYVLSDIHKGRVKKMIRKHLHKLTVVTLGAFLLFTCSTTLPVSSRGNFAARFLGTSVAQAAIWSLEEMITLLAGLGGAGGVVLLVAATTGLAGGAALVAALAMLGGPFGILGGIFAVAGIAILVKYIADYGFEYMMVRLVAEWKKDGKSLYQIKADIDDLPGWIVSDSLKRKTKARISECW